MTTPKHKQTLQQTNSWHTACATSAGCCQTCHSHPVRRPTAGETPNTTRSQLFLAISTTGYSNWLPGTLNGNLQVQEPVATLRRRLSHTVLSADVSVIGTLLCEEAHTTKTAEVMLTLLLLPVRCMSIMWIRCMSDVCQMLALAGESYVCQMYARCWL